MENNDIFFAFDVPFKDVLNKYIVASEAFSEEQIKPSILMTVQLFLRPSLGEDVVDHMVTIANTRTVGTVEAMALNEARYAVSNLALWFNFDELNTHLTDQGWKREEGDTYKSLYHYQVIDLKTSYRNKGFNALDRLIRLLSSAKHIFPEITSSPAYIEKDRTLVQGPDEIEKFFAIQQSPLVYMALKPNLKIVTENELQNLIGSACYDLLMGYLNDTARADRTDSLVMSKLRSACAAYVICITLARQMEFVGSLTDRGMYFDTISAGDRNSIKTSVLPESDRLRIADTLRRDAERYKGRLLSFIELNLTDYFVGRPGEAFNRDNECKRTFWA